MTGIFFTDIIIINNSIFLFIPRYIHFFTNPYDIRILDKMKNITNHKSLYQFTSRLAGGKHAIDNSGEFDPLGPEVTKAMMTSMAGPSTLSRIAEACCKSTLYAFRCLQENELVLKGKPVSKITKNS